MDHIFLLLHRSREMYDWMVGLVNVMLLSRFSGLPLRTLNIVFAVRDMLDPLKVCLRILLRSLELS